MIDRFHLMCDIIYVSKKKFIKLQSNYVNDFYKLRKMQVPVISL